MNNNLKNKTNYLLTTILVFGFITMLIPSCTHESLLPVDPNPIDTTGNPIDPNPSDTLDGIPCDPNVVYFSKDILPLLQSNCAKSGCHDAITHEEGIILDNYANVMASRILKPYKVNDSEIIEVITENDSDDRMPPAPAQKLNNDQIALISKWIQQGAKELVCDENAGQCVTTNISYSGFVAPLLTTYCVGCHSGGTPSGGFSLNTYEGVRSIALSGRLYGAISWSPGFKQMPQGGNKLSQCNIDKVKSWIDNGAANN